MDCQSQTPTSQDSAFFGKYVCRLGIVVFNPRNNWWVGQLQKSEFPVLVPGFEKLGLKLDNCRRTTKNAYCRIYSLCLYGVVYFHCELLEMFWRTCYIQTPIKNSRVVRHWIFDLKKKLLLFLNSKEVHIISRPHTKVSHSKFEGTITSTRASSRRSAKLRCWLTVPIIGVAPANFAGRPIVGIDHR